VGVDGEEDISASVRAPFGSAVRPKWSQNGGAALEKWIKISFIRGISRKNNISEGFQILTV